MQPIQLLKRIETEPDGDILVVRVLCAEMFDEQCDGLRREFAAVLDEYRPRYVVLDLRAVTMISSLGVGVVIGLLRRCQSRSGELALCGLAPIVDEVFRLCRLVAGEGGGIFRTFPDAATAVAAGRNGAK